MYRKDWWKQTTIYQIYPLSYKDSNGDGFGDIRGIISRLDYIKELGFETIWISPFYKTPLKDFGYDISDYQKIDPLFGTMKDVNNLIKEVHKRDMKIIFDMVMNHTSDQHNWFLESKKDKVNLKRDWYIWKKGKGKKAPTNWYSMVGNPGWNYDESTDEWYYASFLPFQPDLNYNNAEVKEEMFDIVRFWLEKGVDGFRLDIFNCIIKDTRLRNNPFTLRYIPSMNNPDGFFQRKIYNMNMEKNFEFARELRKVIDVCSPQKFILGEVSGNNNVIRKFLGEKNDGLNLIFLFESIEFKFKAAYFKKIIQSFEKYYPDPYMPVYVYGNHDRMRYMSKIDNNIFKAKLLSLIQFTVRGVPVVYYGEEIGMHEKNIPIMDAKDPLANKYKKIPQFIIKILNLYVNRDGCRTPMQWDSDINSGFSDSSKTWLPLNDNYKKINVEKQLKDEHSLINHYKNIIALRKKSPVLLSGKLALMDTPPNILCYKRYNSDQELTVICNFSGKKKHLHHIFSGKLLYSTYNDRNNDLRSMRPYEAIIISKH